MTFTAVVSDPAAAPTEGLLCRPRAACDVLERYGFHSDDAFCNVTCAERGRETFGRAKRRGRRTAPSAAADETVTNE